MPKGNPYHEPAGSSKGGQFAPKTGASGVATAARKGAGIFAKNLHDEVDRYNVPDNQPVGIKMRAVSPKTGLTTTRNKKFKNTVELKQWLSDNYRDVFWIDNVWYLNNDGSLLK